MITAAAEWVPIKALAPWDKNPRKNDHKIPEAVASLKRFGFCAPIVAWKSKGMIVAGHLRLKAMQNILREDPGYQLDDAPEPGMVPVRFREFASDAEAAAYALRDNNQIGEWDDGMLAGLLKELNEGGTPIDGLGWSDDDLAKMLAGATPELQPEELDESTLEPPAEPVSVIGEVYELGPHRLVCGSSLEAESWEKLMEGEKAQLVWTDPPYGVNFSTDHLREWDGGKKREVTEIKNDDLAPEQLEQFLRDAFGMAAAHSEPGAAWYVASPAMSQHFFCFATVLKDLDIWKHTLAWVKSSLVMGRSDYHYRHESIFYGWVPGAGHYFTEERTHDSILEFDRPHRNADHPTMKPVELVQHCIRNSSKPGWLVCDPFGGSGTTLIAAATEKRVARLIELDPKYCDVIRRRFGAFAKKNGLEPGSGAL